MAATIPTWVWVHTVAVEPLLGTGGHGEVYGEAVTYDCLVDNTARLVRQPDGREVVAATQVFLPAGTSAPPVGSRATLPAPWSRTTAVISVADRDGGGLPTPDHVHLGLE